MSFRALDQEDPDVAQLIRNEFKRQSETLELIASENLTSPAILEALGTLLTNKYAEGYPGPRDRAHRLRLRPEARRRGAAQDAARGLLRLFASRRLGPHAPDRGLGRSDLVRRHGPRGGPRRGRRVSVPYPACGDHVDNHAED